ncbi:hypothetical protein [Serinibacter salmoneus]|uniref:Uncharacterized protein n=1 Tax=Serinibacter salmoneus TaxID=556530 RepID=A0A2A9CY83_9MICO|nr:hypothetical protein [Serinibacter salmoneus]PFG18632.1 hypothetical protein ATL40_0175 [Serinibacter salmoneus]
MSEGSKEQSGSGHGATGRAVGRNARRVIVTVTEDVEKALPTLEGAGLHVERTLTAIHMVVGVVDEDHREALMSLPGVAVEDDTEVSIPPGEVPEPPR